MGVAVAYFEKWDMEPEPTATDKEEKSYCFWIVTEPFRGMRFRIYVRYLLVETAPLLRDINRNNAVASPLSKPMFMG